VDPALDDTAASKEAQILEAAEAVFTERGYGRARMQHIADRAGVSKASVHYYFRSKDALYRRVLSAVTGELVAQVDAALSASSSLEQTLHGFVSLFVDYVSNDPRAIMFVLQELSRGGSTGAEALTIALAGPEVSFPQRMGALLEREHAAGRIVAVDPLQFLVTLVGSCMYFFLAEPIVRGIAGAMRPDEAFDRARFIEERKSSVFDVLYLGLKARDDDTRHAVDDA